MSISRRGALGLLAGGAPALKLAQGFAPPAGPQIPAGPFQGTRESLKAYKVPDWFRDAKFGIWAHWGPQSSTELGDWYARNMYMEGSKQYQQHIAKYGHPTKFGYKDIIPTWKAEKFDPEHLMSLYKKAGAKYFVSMGVHHDNFDLWNSKHQRWNSVKMGPKKDIVGMFHKAALKQGLKFGVSEHLAVSYHWFQTSHGADKEGQYKGIPYDGAVDKPDWDLYHETHAVPKKKNGSDDPWNPENVPDKWKLHYFNRMKDLIDNYEPDLLYTDGPIFFEEYGLSFVAHLYNQSAKKNKGVVQAVYNSKRREDSEAGTCVLDLERGVVDKIWPNPWQTDTCVGNWHYNKGYQYKSAKTVIDLLVDIVSRNGNLLLNFPLNSAGTLDSDEEKTLAGVTAWMAVNSEGIYGTRPWKIFGEGPGTADSAKGGGNFNERTRKELTAADVRFTTKGKTLYAFCMGVPGKQAIVAPLAKNSPHGAGKIQNVELLGLKGKLKWSQDETGLKVELPEKKPCENAITLKITNA
jgi:alpha-L-fucosidase